MIIAISGKIGSGKDTFAKLLNQHIKEAKGFEFENRKFASNLKLLVANLINCKPTDLEDQDFKKSELPVEWNYLVERQYTTGASIVSKPMTVRDLLISIGEGLRNVCHPDVWVNGLLSHYTSYSNWLVTDLRYENEMNSIKSRVGSICIRIEREGLVKIDSPSETSLDKASFDFVVHNNGTLDELSEKAKFILHKSGVL